MITHGLALVGHGVAAVAFGPALLVFAPLVLGVPHLAATARHVPAGFGRLRKSWAVPAALMLFALVAAVRYAGPGWSAVLYEGRIPRPELAAMVIAAVVAGFASRRALAVVAMLALCGALATGFALSPLVTLATLLFTHHLTAYVYWWRLAETREQRRAAIFGAGLALAVAGVIGAGLCDPLLGSTEASAHWARATMPFLEDGLTIRRVTAIAAFGQLMHYFVWLRAIPRAAPVARASVPLGKPILIATAVAAVALVTVAAIDLNAARTLYLALAGAHGYVELGALPFLLLEADDARS